MTQDPTVDEQSGADDERSASGRHRRGSTLRTGVLIGAAALTVAGLGMGIGYAARRGQATRDVNAAKNELDGVAGDDAQYCRTSSDPGGQCQLVSDAVANYDRIVAFERAGFITAGAAAGVFVATWVFWPVSARTPTVAVGPSPGGALLYASGSF